MIKYYFSILLLLITYSSELCAQTHVTLVGRVLEQQTDEPIRGVSVSVKGNDRSGAVITGSQGTFRILAHQGQKLIVSHV